jgi:hypothetical protein
MTMAIPIHGGEEQPVPKEPFTAIAAMVGADEEQPVSKSFPNSPSSRPPRVFTVAIGAMDGPLLV